MKNTNNPNPRSTPMPMVNNVTRAAKFEWRRIAYPHKDEKEVNIYIYIFRECGCRKCSFVHIKFRMKIHSYAYGKQCYP
jgi:hypothetical protein